MSLAASPVPFLPRRSIGAWLRGSKAAAGFAAVCILAVALRLAVYWWMARPFGGLDAALCRFDCDFYLRIAQGGYGVDAQFHDRGAYPNWAYFPLLPLLVRLGTALTGWPGALCGTLIANAALAAFACAGGAYLQRTRRAVDPALWLLAVLAAPYGLFFTMPYTEALFAALATLVLLARVQRRTLLAAGCAALAAATRPTGVLLSALVIADQLRVLWALRRTAGPERDRAVLALAIAPLGLVLYMGWQYASIGDGLAFSHVQVAWDRRWLGPVTWLLLGLRTGDWNHAAGLFAVQSYAFNATAALLGLGLAGWLALRRRWAEAWLAAASLLLPLASGLHSMGRFVGTNPAILFAAYDLLRTLGPTARAGVLMLMVAGQAALVLAWYTRAGGLF